MKIAVTGLVLWASFALCSASHAQGELPPGGPAWVRVQIDSTGQPRGYVEYEKYCSSCHSVGPEDRPGYTALQARYKGALPAALPDRTDLVAEYVKHVVRNGVSIMPRARKSEISDAELDAIASYLTRNNASN